MICLLNHEIKNITITPEILKLIAEIDEFHASGQLYLHGTEVGLARALIAREVAAWNQHDCALVFLQQFVHNPFDYFAPGSVG